MTEKEGLSELPTRGAQSLLRVTIEETFHGGIRSHQDCDFLESFCDLLFAELNLFK
jgi:hypothetical protein